MDPGPRPRPPARASQRGPDQPLDDLALREPLSAECGQQHSLLEVDALLHHRDQRRPPEASSARSADSTRDHGSTRSARSARGMPRPQSSSGAERESSRISTGAPCGSRGPQTSEKHAPEPHAASVSPALRVTRSRRPRRRRLAAVLGSRYWILRGEMPRISAALLRAAAHVLERAQDRELLELGHRAARDARQCRRHRARAA